MSDDRRQNTGARILRVDASMRREGSTSRQLTDYLIAKLAEEGAGEVTVRDLADGAPFVDESWIGANFTPADDRSDQQKTVLKQSDALIAEIMAADILVIGSPIYNFGLPAALKAWIDQVCRAGVTFRYTPDGPKGLLEGKRAYVLMASGGTQVGSDIDFASRHSRHVLGFIGVEEVTLIAADKLMSDKTRIDGALQQIDAAFAATADQ